ncbi:hypothetical protein, partial [Spirillospora sp. NPDC048823]|uniref:hypothetical protein n=1 Tax=unclassified Spirillospora TaxID=2642701 RepID=UPI0037178527
MASVGGSGDVDLVGVGRLEAIVEPAGQSEIIDVGGVVVQGPAGHVVHLAQRPWHFAAAHYAGGVQRFENSALPRAGESGGAAEVE